MKIGLMTAMNSELDALLPHVYHQTVREAAGLTIHEGDIDGLPVALCAGGICKVNAALAAQTLISAFGVTHVIMAGIAGGIDPRLGVHALAFSQRLAQHDADPDIFRRYRPFVQDGWFPGDSGMLAVCRALNERNAFLYPAFFGDMVSGEQFIDQNGRQEIIARWHPLCVDMESAAAAHACYVNGVPFIAIRAMSDTGDESGAAAASAHEYTAAQAASSAAISLIREMAKGE